MKFKIADIKKIEIFAPGTAGERAIRVETKEKIEIINESDVHSIHIIEKKNFQVSIEISKFGEDHDASGYVYFQGMDEHLLGETLKDCWDQAVEILKNENLEFPSDNDFEIEEESGGYSSVSWQNFEDTRKDLESFVEDFYKTDTDFPGSLGKIS